MKIVLLSNHWYPSPRRAGFHHLANAWHSQGHTISFITVGFSIISWLRRDFRCHFKGIYQACNKWQHICDKFDSYVFFTLWHPHTTMIPSLDRFLSPYLLYYDRLIPQTLIERISEADIIVYESCTALYLFQFFNRISPSAKHIYRVSDDIRTMKSTPYGMITLEEKIYQQFSMISTPCSHLIQKFKKNKNTIIHKHGLHKEYIDNINTSPYNKKNINIVFCGIGFYDRLSVHLMAKNHPDIYFHIIGIKRPLGHIPDNILYYGEIPYRETIPYIKYADVGLYTLKPSASRPMDAYTDSLKIMQYRYCGLPIIAPDFLNLNREGVFYYTPGQEESCSKTIINAIKHGKHKEYANEICSWNKVALNILEDAIKCT
ncbi:MAG: hypothetical protein IJA79_09730 [Desulfovibrio sp.]|nr:hypothetical protein [Desulfovibrio sp.]